MTFRTGNPVSKRIVATMQRPRDVVQRPDAAQAVVAARDHPAAVGVQDRRPDISPVRKRLDEAPRLTGSIASK